MKKIVLVLIILVLSLPTFSQEIVFDPTSYIAIIKQTIEIVKQVEMMYNQASYLYQQLRLQVESSKDTNWNDYNSVMNMLNSQANYLADLETLSKNLNVNINGKNLKIWEVQPLAQEYQDYVTDVLENGLDDYEKSGVESWMGMNANLQKYYNQANDLFTTSQRRTIAYMNKWNANKDQRMQLKTALENQVKNGSVKAQAQTTNQYLEKIATNLDDLIMLTGDAALAAQKNQSALQGDVVGPPETYSDEFKSIWGEP